MEIGALLVLSMMLLPRFFFNELLFLAEELVLQKNYLLICMVLTTVLK